MPALLPLITEILTAVLETVGLMSSVVSILNFIKGVVPNLALETSVSEVKGVELDIMDELTSATLGFPAVLTQLASILTAVEAVGTPQQASDPVILPTTPPSGYGGLDGGATGDAVWGYIMDGEFYTAKDYLLYAGQFLGFNLSYISGWPNANYFLPFGNPGAIDPNGGVSYAAFLPQDILPGETMLANITRQNPGWGIAWADAPGGHLHVIADPGLGQWGNWITAFDEAGYNAIAGASTSATLAIAPVWPGLAKVVLGTSMAITPGMTIPGPLHGLIVAITGVPTGANFFSFDGDLSYRNLGQVTFQDDNGQLEQATSLGFTSALYCPHAMTVAASARLRTSAAVTGTVTPWLAA